MKRIEEQRDDQGKLVKIVIYHQHGHDPDKVIRSSTTDNVKHVGRMVDGVFVPEKELPSKNRVSHTVKLDKHTFGKAPAAMYLALLLNERGDQTLTRKVTTALRNTRTLINDLVAAHYNTDELKTDSFNSLMALVQLKVNESVKLIPDEFIAHLVQNILTGELRVHKRRAIETSKLQVQLNRSAKNGETPERLKVLPRAGELTEDERIEVLQARSRRYLERKGKRNTLY